MYFFFFVTEKNIYNLFRTSRSSVREKSRWPAKRQPIASNNNEKLKHDSFVLLYFFVCFYFVLYFNTCVNIFCIIKRWRQSRHECLITQPKHRRKKTSLDSRCDVKEISSLIWNTHVPFSPKWKQEKYYKYFFRVETETRCVRTGDGCGCVGETCVTTRKFSLNCIIVCCSITLLFIHACFFGSELNVDLTRPLSSSLSATLLFFFYYVWYVGLTRLWNAIKCIFNSFSFFYSYLNS